MRRRRNCIPPVVEVHECKHLCATCDKCTDENCEDEACAEKCEGHQVIQPVDPDNSQDKPVPGGDHATPAAEDDGDATAALVIVGIVLVLAATLAVTIVVVVKRRKSGKED